MVGIEDGSAGTRKGELSMFRALGCAVLCITAVLAALAIAPGQAHADHVSCGDVITEDTTLDSDLFCFESGDPALTIGADGIRLDLGGHEINSVASPGVVNEGHDRVTIADGEVGTPCPVAIFLRGADHNRLKDLAAGGGGCGPGAVLEDSDHNRLVRSEFGADDGGVDLHDGSDRNVISRNVLQGGVGGGLAITDSDRNVVSRNIFPRDGGDIGDDLFVGTGSDNTTVRRNDLQGPGFHDGIGVSAEATGTLLVRNEVRGYLGDGIQVDSPFTTLTRNSSNDNGGWGILAVAGVTDGGGNTASGNLLGQCLNVSC
jgi:parallel beta-helix repeat protein